MSDPTRPIKRNPRSRRELIVVTHPAARLRSAGATVSSLGGMPVSSLNSLLQARGVTLRPLFAASEELAAAVAGDVRPNEADDVPDPATFYVVEGGTGDLEALAKDFMNEPTVDGAYVAPAAEPPEWYDRAARRVPAPQSLAVVTPDFSARQGYLDAAPGGIAARFAWTRPGGRGAGVRVIDLEWGWNFQHEDLLENQSGIVAGTGDADTDHGTAVLGIISSDANSRGVIGIAAEAQVSAVAFSMPTATAITTAVTHLRAGDILLLEIHQPGPRFQFKDRKDQRGYIAVEWWPEVFAAILYATRKGILVVEAAGNGAENLDDALYGVRPAGFPSTWRNPFDPSNPQCGAVTIGAGAPPPGTHGRTHGADRSRLDFSNFGRALDAQGWGLEVTTTGRAWGVADLFDGGPDAWYTDQFAGTSSASPLVVGALACVQGVLRVAGKAVLTPAGARSILRETGSPQQAETGSPTMRRIGNRPDLGAILANI